MRPPWPRLIAAAVLFAAILNGPSRAADEGWIELIGSSGGLDAFRGSKDHPGWETVGGTTLNPANLKRLAGYAGTGVVYNGSAGRAPNLVTKQKFGDVEVHIEFMVPRNSNSGVKLESVYEIQIFDSYGVKQATASHSGGIYPRAELLPTYHHIDEGYPPLVNAALPPGEWQTLDITYRAPRFDGSGKKTASARFVKVVLNGQVVQDDLEVPCPTGPLLLQGDHGPVAFRNVRVRPLH